MKRRRCLLIVDCMGWAFENIARQIERHYADKFTFEVIANPRDAYNPVCDVAVWFWWVTAARCYRQIKSRRNVVCLYDHWSMTKNDFRTVLPATTAFCAGNERIYAWLRQVAPWITCHLTEDGVDTSLFTPQPFPAEFTVGWTGNRCYNRMGLGDFKGVGMIEDACKLAGVPLRIADKQQGYVPHNEMPEKFYRNISCYVCASEAEGTPNPVLEALACGRPVISTNVGVVRKVVGENAGRIVKRSTEAIASAIQEVRDSDAEAMSFAARASVANWDWSNKVQAFWPALEV